LNLIKRIQPDIFLSKKRIVDFSFSQYQDLTIARQNNWFSFVIGIATAFIIDDIALKKIQKKKIVNDDKILKIIKDIAKSPYLYDPTLSRRLNLLKQQEADAIELVNEIIGSIYVAYMSSDGPLSAISTAFHILSLSLSSFVKNQRYVEPLRGVTKRKFTINDAGGDVYSSMLGQDDKDEKIKYIVKHYLKHSDISDIVIKRSDISDDELEVKLVNDSGKERNIRDFGFGFSQVLPILYKSLDSVDFNIHYKKIKTRSQFTKPPQILIIEQPEIHLHPAIQSKLASFFLQVHLDFNTTFIIETHSEHLILSNQVQIRNDYNKAKPQNIYESSKIFFVNKKKIRGEKVRKASTVDAINFKVDGMLSKPFPDDFFDLSMIMYRDLVKPK